ncbi:uncharacterized protein LOC121378194 [Gigantopelta aegis]|uniref:uncharacterized protein LOC121378194 n=1 Tax=Gigantopelta aegis TaxID=1735272 RepID=UPI001B88DBC5|nr:uncharacterized protein LOC121378194 [Gigantopelta aegis]
MYNRLGLFYTSVCKYRCAKICFEHAKENLPDEDNIITAVILQNLGTACSLLREFKEASKYQAQAAKIYGKFKEEEQQGHCFLNRGYAYSQLNMLEEAKDAFLQASLVAARCDDKMSEWQAQESLGAVEANLNRFDRARNHLEEALYAARLHSNDKHSKSCQRIFLKLQQVVRLIPSKRMTEELKTEVHFISPLPVA